MRLRAIMTHHLKSAINPCSIRFAFGSFIYIGIFFFALTSNVSATEFYVDFSSGADTNDGTSTSTPFTHCPGDDYATSNAATTTLSGGDIVYFKGGVEYKGRIDIDWSGSGGNYITYDGNSAGTWGTGRAIIDGENVRYRGFYAAGARDYIKIDNFEIRDIKHGTAAYSHAGIQIGSTGSDSDYITIEDCYIWDVGYWENDGVNTPSGYGIKIDRPVNCTIQNNILKKTSKCGIQLYGAKSCTIDENTIGEYISWGLDLAGEYQTPTNNTISDNTFYDMWHHDCKGNTSCTAEEGCWTGNCASNPHTDYLFIRKGSGVNPEDTIVERNLFYNDKDFTDLSYDGTAFVSEGGTRSIYRNNVFINPHSYMCFQTETNSTDTEIYNNTFYHPRYFAVRMKVAGVKIKNNIIIGTSSYYFMTEAVHDDIDSDYNLFVDISCISKWEGVGCQDFTLSEWQTATGDDSHSPSSVASVADIKFQDISGYPSSCSSMDLRLQSDSPAVNTGTTISGFTNDYDNISRPQGSAWDIGAYEFSLPPAPPTNLEIISKN